MTGEEARAQLIALREHCADMRRYATRGESTWDDDVKALEMALKALEQETVTEFADKCRECGKMRFIEDIKTEIENLIEWHDCPIELDNGNDYWYCQACVKVLEIIDKHTSGKEKE